MSALVSRGFRRAGASLHRYEPEIYLNSGLIAILPAGLARWSELFYAALQFIVDRKFRANRFSIAIML